MESASGSTDTGAKNQSQKREVYLKWKDYFMSIALVAGLRSKDPDTQVGACIVNEDKKIVGIGYNGFPWGIDDDSFSWLKPYKHLYVLHAEENAIINRSSNDLKNSTIYVSLFPCNRCAQAIIQSRIKSIVYMSDEKSDKPEYMASKRMLDAAKIPYKKFESSFRGIELDFANFRNQQIKKNEKKCKK